ncbi:HD-GYP domain-containing protein [Methylobacterium oryzihabitans]|uniref:HD domain-containing protein n=1 Tax=Methylobacterium oryzihabitans TaxID=2499852 RepID=A0A3S3UAI8_9HYPH|nr:HD domain-containing phosphohydrolase [Methylobacterium oryzihabitans]RVU19452.1 HD domain-containing protein [Methylobacterium oryzihabitans]
MAAGTIVLVTDRLDRSEDVAKALREVSTCTVVGADVAWSRMRDVPLGVVCDLTLARPVAVQCLRSLTTRFKGQSFPVVCLLRRATGDALREAKSLGATVCLPAYAPPQTIAGALAKHLEALDSADLRVARGVARAGETLTSLLAEARTGNQVRAAPIETGLAPILTAVQDGGLSLWLDRVWTHDDATYQHCLMVAGLAAHFAVHLGFGEDDQRRFVRAALVHDVGKARIPLAILNKPGRLDPEEMAVMRTHAALGYDILRASGEWDALTLDVVRHHHEMLDGSGYPDGLSGPEITDMVRLLTICDIYAALTERRPYKEPMAMRDAMAILAGMEGKLEARLVQIFGEAVARAA